MHQKNFFAFLDKVLRIVEFPNGNEQHPTIWEK